MNADSISKLVENRNARSVQQMEQDATSIINQIAKHQESKQMLDVAITKLRTELLALEAEQHTVADILGAAQAAATLTPS